MVITVLHQSFLQKTCNPLVVLVKALLARRLTMETQLWAIAVKGSASQSALKEATRDLAALSPFKIPGAQLRVGTLDSLMSLSDDLVKMDVLAEATVTKMYKQLVDLKPDDDPTIIGGALAMLAYSHCDLLLLLLPCHLRDDSTHGLRGHGLAPARWSWRPAIGVVSSPTGPLLSAGTSDMPSWAGLSALPALQLTASGGFSSAQCLS